MLVKVKQKKQFNFLKLKNLRQHNIEANAIEILKPITKFSKQITNPDTIKYYLDKAFFEAKNSRPGPVYLEIISMYSLQNLVWINIKLFYPKKEKINKLNHQLIKKYLSKSSRPIILLGNGINVAQQSTKISQIIKKLKIPTLTTQLEKEAIDYENDFIGHFWSKRR